MANNVNVIGDAVNPVQGDNEAIQVESPDLVPAGNTEGTISKQNQEIPKDQAPTGQTYPIGDMAQPGQFDTRESEQDPAKDNPSRHEYWQSQHDKVNNELGTAQQELTYYKEQLGPLADYLHKNPNIVNAIDQQFSNGQPQGQPQQQAQPVQGNQDAPLQKPSRPTKPSDYNEVDAYNDPDSSSFKFRTTMDGYRDDMIGFMESKDMERERFAQQQMAQQQLYNQQQTAISHVKQNYGFDDGKASDFVNFITNPQNVTYDNLVEIYNKKTGPSQQDIQARQEMAKAKKREERLKVPRDTISTPGATAPPVSDEQAFSNDLIRSGKRR